MHRKILIAGAVLASALPLAAQTQRADAASRTVAGQARVTAATQSSEYVSQLETDMGEQVPVSARSGGLGAYVIGETGLYYSSNPSLSNGGGRGDMYFVAKGGGGVRPNVVGSLYLDAHVSEEIYQYAQFSSLNFNRFNAGGGFDYVFENLGGLTASVRYEYERFLNGGNLKEFYVNNAINVTLAKEFALNDIHALQTGWQGSFSVDAQPSYAQRNEYDWWFGWRWRILEPLELQTYYVVSLYHYPNEDRVDLTQNVGGTLTYAFTRWARLSASAGFGANNSTDSYFNYTVVNLGGTLGLDIRF